MHKPAEPISDNARCKLAGHGAVKAKRHMHANTFHVLPMKPGAKLPALIKLTKSNTGFKLHATDGKLTHGASPV